MDCLPPRPTRRRLRLDTWDYRRAAAYFVTICIRRHRCLYGHVRGGVCVLNPAGEMVRREWLQLSARHPQLHLDSFVIMPNHMHGLLGLYAPAHMRDPLSLPAIVGGFKAATTREYAVGVRGDGWQRFDSRLWQRGYWDRIVRNDRELAAIREYIDDNPGAWARDRYFREGG